MFARVGATRERHAKRLRAGHNYRASCGWMLCLGDVGHAQDCSCRHTAAIAITPGDVFSCAVSGKICMDHLRRVSRVLVAINFLAAGFRLVTIPACNGPQKAEVATDAER